jgi:hypothetical protein
MMTLPVAAAIIFVILTLLPVVLTELTGTAVLVYPAALLKFGTVL